MEVDNSASVTLRARAAAHRRALEAVSIDACLDTLRAMQKHEAGGAGIDDHQAWSSEKRQLIEQLETIGDRSDEVGGALRELKQ